MIAVVSIVSRYDLIIEAHQPNMSKLPLYKPLIFALRTVVHEEQDVVLQL